MALPKPIVYQLIYVSAAKVLMAPAELGELLLKARAHNRRVGVGGLLVHQDGSFFQVLEGPQPAVDTLYTRISRDDRHHRVHVLSRADVTEAAFLGWSMGFVDGGQGGLAALPGFNDFFRRGFEKTAGSPNLGHAKELVLAFREGRFRQFVKL